jgi:hypothetical protein
MYASKPDLTAIVKKMAENLNGLRYGSVSVMLKVHEGRIVDINHTVTQTTKELTTPHGKKECNNER